MQPLFGVLVLYNNPSILAGVGQESDAGILQEVEAVCQALEGLGYPYRRAGIDSLAHLRNILPQSSEPVVINLVEALQPDVQDASLVPSICRAFGKSCTGNGTLALMLGLDKWRAKALFEHAGLPVPRGVIVLPGHPLPLEQLPARPFIVKPVAADASEGIDDSSLVDKPGAELVAAVERIHRQFRQAALVEQYVGQRELNVSILQTAERVAVLPIAEIDFSALGERPHIVGYAAKWLVDSFEYQHTPRLLPAPLDEAVAERVCSAALEAWNAIGCQDYARVDMRLGDEGEPFIIEVNPNPDIAPDAGYAAALQAGGISFNQFIDTILQNAWQRHQQLPAVSLDLAAPDVPSSRSIRPTVLADRTLVQSMLERSRFFRADEVTVALEVLDDALTRTEESSYASFVLEEAQTVLGWICCGPNPCTLGTYDIYWLVVEPAHKSAGVGSALLRYAEDCIRILHGRLAVVETSGSDLYYPTRQFYLKRGYREEARLVDFYAPGDDKVIYTKVIAQG